MKIAIASCRDLPSWEVDDKPFFESLTKHQIDYEVHAWDAKIDWSQFDACLIRTTWDYQERFDEFTQWISSVSEQTKLFNPTELLLWNSHKSYLKELEDNQIAIAPSVWLEQGKAYDIQTIMQQKGWEKGFIKPLIGANARECCRFDISLEALKTAQEHCQRLLPQEDLVLQPYLGSVETFGETSGIFFNQEFSHGTRKIPVKGDFRVQDDYGAKDIPYQLSEQEEALAQKALDYVSSKFGRLLYARIDFLHASDGTPYLNEMELIEPSLFFRHGKEDACDRLSQAILERLKA